MTIQFSASIANARAVIEISMRVWLLKSQSSCGLRAALGQYHHAVAGGSSIGLKVSYAMTSTRHPTATA
jgi:hypothetical protein